MTACEMMLSEGEERMLMVLNPDRKATARAIFAKWDLDFAVIGETIPKDRFLVLHQGRVMADLPLSHLSSQAPLRPAPPRHRLQPKVRGTPPMPISARDIENLIRAAFPQARVRVDGDDGQHFAAEVIDESFRGLNRVQQQRAVYAALKGRMDGPAGELHALALTTKAPDRESQP